MTNKKFKMKRKPQEPVRLMVEHRKEMYEFSTLQKIFNFFNNIDISYEDVKIQFDYDDRYFKWELPETDESFNNRMNIYNQKLDEYNKWLEEHKEEVEKLAQEQEIERALKKEEKIKTLQKQKAKLESLLKRMGE